jgi:uncharacterized protein YndB with AHSA1/START domain
MTTPDVPHRYELTLTVPGTPEQVWDAIATAQGISSWMMQTDLDERVGGAVTFHMGPEDASHGTVTDYDRPRRIAYEEDWASLVGQAGAPVTPLVTEFVVEAQSGGTCVVRVVTSAFGVGADWENEFFDDMAVGWTPMLENLRLYLTHFAGQHATTLEAAIRVDQGPTEVTEVIRAALGAGEVGSPVEARGVTAVVERVGPLETILRLTAPVPGLLAVWAFGPATGPSSARVAGYLFGDGAPDYVEREQAEWARWLETLDLNLASTGTTSA